VHTSALDHIGTHDRGRRRIVPLPSAGSALARRAAAAVALLRAMLLAGVRSGAASLPARCRRAAAAALPAAAARSSSAASTSEPDAAAIAGGLPAVGDRLELTCERLGHGGVGICLLGPTSVVVLCERALPGERLSAVVTAVSRSHAEARKVATLAAHRDAVEPACPHFSQGCGGCHFQALAYPAQLAAKHEIVAQTLARVGKVAPDTLAAALRPALPAPSPFAYRNKTTFTFAARSWAPTPDAPDAYVPERALGMLRPGSATDVLPIASCSLQSDAANAILAAVGELCAGLQPFDAAAGTGLLRSLVIRAGRGGSQHLVQIITAIDAAAALAPVAEALVARFPSVAAGSVVASVAPHTGRPGAMRFKSHATLHGPGHITERLAGLDFGVQPGTFLQVNTDGAEALYRVVADAAGLRPGQLDVVWDLFCGGGAIGLSLASAARHVHGVDVVPSAIADARRNAATNGISNATFAVGDLAEAARALAAGGARRGGKAGAEQPPPPDVIVVDPARDGLDPSAVAWLAGCASARRLVYVSCNVRTAARDLDRLCNGPGARFRLVSVTPVDLYPQTHHCEMVATLERMR